MPENGQEKKKVINALLAFSFSSLVFSISPGGLKNRRYEKKEIGRETAFGRRRHFEKRKLLLKHKRDRSEKTFITDQKATTPDSVFIFDDPFLAPFNVEQITHCSIIVGATTFRGPHSLQFPHFSSLFSI